jgi:hypothetical protein
VNLQLLPVLRDNKASLVGVESRAEALHRLGTEGLWVTQCRVAETAWVRYHGEDEFELTSFVREQAGEEGNA